MPFVMFSFLCINSLVLTPSACTSIHIAGRKNIARFIWRFPIRNATFGEVGVAFKMIINISGVAAFPSDANSCDNQDFSLLKHGFRRNLRLALNGNISHTNSVKSKESAFAIHIEPTLTGRRGCFMHNAERSVH